MKLEVRTKTIYLDLIGNQFENKEDAERSNHEIQLKFRKYIEEELLVTFSDGKYDKLSTTKNIFDMLEFTPSCIRKYYDLMCLDN